MKATEQYFPVMLFVMLCKAVAIFASLDENLNCDHPNESSSEEFSNGKTKIWVK